MRESTLVIAANITRAIGTQALGGVVVRIEADAKKMGFVVQGAIGCKPSIDVGKIVCNPRAEVGQRAARVDKGNQQLFAAKLIELNCPAILVTKLEVGHGI